MTSSLEKQEALVKQYIQANETSKAVKLLCKMAIESAQAKDFLKAESLRDWLYKVDTMALAQIVKINEVLETEKTKALNVGKRELWVNFFNILSDEEANAFFYSLKTLRIGDNQTVLQQGVPNDRLFLIERGELKMVFTNEQKNLLIKRLGRGDFFGQETFFSVNVCTVSVITLSEVELSYIDKNTFESLKGKEPMLHANLKKVCSSQKSIYDLLRQKGLDRRAHKRIHLQTKVHVQELQSNKKHDSLPNQLVAELWDISKTGLSFYFQSKQKNVANRLVGRNLSVQLTLQVGGQKKDLRLTGIVHGVQSHPLDEYSVHIRLNRSFSDSAIKTIYRIANMH